jgi:hypothetical protein
MPATILVVEDEGDIAILLRYNLEASASSPQKPATRLSTP